MWDVIVGFRRGADRWTEGWKEGRFTRLRRLGGVGARCRYLGEESDTVLGLSVLGVIHGPTLVHDPARNPTHVLTI